MKALEVQFYEFDQVQFDEFDQCVLAVSRLKARRKKWKSSRKKKKILNQEEKRKEKINWTIFESEFTAVANAKCNICSQLIKATWIIDLCSFE